MVISTMIRQKKYNNDYSSGLSGFFQGYNSANIASIESTLQYHINEIQIIFKNLTSNLREDSRIKFDIEQCIKIFKNEDFEYSSKLVQFGEMYKRAVLKLINDKSDSIYIDNEGSFKKIAVHYLLIAKEMESEKINYLAIEIGELLE